MKTKLIIILKLLLLLNTGCLFSQNDYCAIKVEITSLKNSKGVIALQLAGKNGEVVKGVISSIVNNRCEIVIDSLASGTYSIRFFHDENSNDKLDTNWLGLPTEGYGFSNNASALFGTPSIEDRLFKLRGNLNMELQPKY